MSFIKLSFSLDTCELNKEESHEIQWVSLIGGAMRGSFSPAVVHGSSTEKTFSVPFSHLLMRGNDLLQSSSAHGTLNNTETG